MARDTATPAGRNGRMLGGSKLLLVLLAGGVGTVLAPGAGAQDASFVARTGAVASVGASQDLDLSQGLPTDPRIVRGVLPNGLTYMVMRHGNPPGKMNIWLHVSTGSLNETDAQRGIAHYLEHMAFNGSTNFAPGTVIDFFQSMGLNFGQHQNAFTSFDQTAYQLTMPDLKPETIDKAMLFMADVKGRLLLTQEEIEAERQVIMEEKRARLNPQMRMLEKMLPRQFPGSIIGSRMPIGVEETIMGMNRDEFVNYYTKWYVPSNMTVMVVADMDPAEVVKHIEKNFSFGEKTPRPVDVPANVTPYTDDGAIVEQDAEVTDASIAMVRVSANRPPSTTIGDMRRDLVEQMASAAFGRRIADKLSKGGTSYTSAGAFGQSLFNAAFLAQASAEGEPNQWKEMLTELGADVQRARLHGFTQRELDDIKKEIMSGAELAVEREGTVPARAVMGRWNSAVAAGEPIMGAAQELAILRSVLPTITPQDVSTVFAGMFEPKNVRFTLTLPASETAPSESELLSLGQQAFAVTPEPLVEEARASSMMETLPAPGTITAQDLHEASGITSATLGNGIRVHHRFMDIRKDTATVTINLAAGEIMETGANRGVSQAASLAWRQQATSRLSSKDVRDLMVGKKVNVGGGAGLDTMTLTIGGSPTDLETGFQLAHLLLTDPVVEAPALEQWKTEAKQAIEARKKTPMGLFQELLPALLFPEGQPRVKPLEVAQVDAVTREAAQEWLRTIVASAPIEVSVVGDVSKDRAMALAAQYLATLPARTPMAKDTLAELRTMQRPAGPREVRKSIKTDTKMAMVLTGFYGPDTSNLPEARAMQMAAQILRTRMLQEVREKQALAYSPNVQAAPGREFPGFGPVYAASPTDVSKVDQLAKTFNEVFAAFAKEGPTDEEMATARTQMANLMDEQMKEPQFWTARMGQMAYRGTTPDDALSLPVFFQEVTPAQVREVFAKYYTPENQMTLIVTPE